MTTRRSFLAASLAASASVLPDWRGLRAAASLKFKTNPFTLGIASGYPTARSVVLWTRVAPSPLEPGGGAGGAVIPVEWELAADDKMTRVVRKGIEYATAEWAHSV